MKKNHILNLKFIKGVFELLRNNNRSHRIYRKVFTESK